MCVFSVCLSVVYDEGIYNLLLIRWRVGGRSPMDSMCTGVCASLVPSLGGGGMSLWLYASGEIWLFVWM